jgi:hypothetical protein
MQVVAWMLDHIAGGLVLAVILALAEIFGLRRHLAGLWYRLPWPHIRRAPRSETETRRLLARRPPGWEYLLLAGCLHRELARHEARYRDHEARYVTPSDLTLPEDGFGGAMSDEMHKALLIVGNWNELINGPPLTRALGEPGEPGDPHRIGHLAERLTSTYVEMMDWSVRLRGANSPEAFSQIVDILARFADQPVQQYRDWVTLVVREIDRVPAVLADKKGEGPVKMTLTLTLSIAPEVMRAYLAEAGRLGIDVEADPEAVG